MYVCIYVCMCLSLHTHALRFGVRKTKIKSGTDHYTFALGGMSVLTGLLMFRHEPIHLEIQF